MTFQKGYIPWNKGKKGYTNHGSFLKGQISWNKGIKGKESSTWRGGRNYTGSGYIEIYKPNHPFNVRGYVREHRLVMEKKLGRHLTKEEVVHHINRIKTDNRIENLKLFISCGKHTHFEWRKKASRCQFISCCNLQNSKYKLCNKHYLKLYHKFWRQTKKAGQPPLDIKKIRSFFDYSITVR